MRWTALAILLCAPAVVASADEPPPALKLERTIPLPGVKGRIDHLAIPCGGTVQIAALGNGTLEQVNCDTGKIFTLARDLPEPQGILVLPETIIVRDSVLETVVACGGDGTVRFFAGPKELQRTETDGDADNLRWDAVAKQVVVAHGGGALSWIDPRTAKITGTAKLDAHPEGFQLEKKGRRMFVNVPGAGHVAVVDRETKTVVDRWKTGDASANFPMALYEGGHRLFVGCRRPARLLVYDTDTGRILQSLECVGDADDIFVERFSDTPRVLVAGGEGFAEVYAQDLKGAYSRHSRVETAPGARTALLEEDQTTFHVAAPARDGKDARILVYRLLPPSFPAGGK